MFQELADTNKIAVIVTALFIPMTYFTEDFDEAWEIAKRAQYNGLPVSIFIGSKFENKMTIFEEVSNA